MNVFFTQRADDLKSTNIFGLKENNNLREFESGMWNVYFEFCWGLDV